MRYLAQLHRVRTWVTPSELLERLVRERHVLEVGVDSGRFRDVARRVRFVVDQSRAFGDAAGGSLRDYLAWATLQGTEGARVVETVLPETDDDAVRIMTIHGAKGLEFPIVICSGASTRANSNRGGVQLFFPPAGGYEVKLAKNAQTDAFELYKAIDEQMNYHEKLRLLYVVCTRASDHLVVSVHRVARDKEVDDPAKLTSAELLWGASAGALGDVDQPLPVPRQAAPAAAVPAPPDYDTWVAEHDKAFATGKRRHFVSATALAQLADNAAPRDPGMMKEGRDLELPPWNKGRYGTAIGRAVHAVLQTVDLANGAGLADLAGRASGRGRCAGTRGDDRAARAVGARKRLGARPCAGEYWRETYVAVPVEGLTLEGYVDLVYRPADATDGSLVVVDYKTDAITDDASLAAKLADYRIQGAAYAIAVAAATGARVDRCVFLFLAQDGPTEVEIAGADLAAAIADVGGLIRSFRDHPPEFDPIVLADA